jgi:hypothetical protein
VARSTAADLTWTFATAIASTNHTGTLTSASTIISNLSETIKLDKSIFQTKDNEKRNIIFEEID